MAKRKTIRSKDSDEARPKLLDNDYFIKFANRDTPPEHIPPNNALLSKNFSDDRRNDTSTEVSEIITDFGREPLTGVGLAICKV